MRVFLMLVLSLFPLLITLPAKSASAAPGPPRLGIPALRAAPLLMAAGRKPGEQFSKGDDKAPETVRLTRKEVAEVQGTYRRALGELAAGERIRAIKTLESLETRYADPQKYGDTGRLWRVQSEVIQQLASREPELLLPVLMLHHDASGRYRSRRIWHLANHSSRLAGVLAGVYAKETGTPGSQVTAGRVLASLGGYLQQSMSTDTCRCTPYYQRALEHQPSNEAALLGLATVYEKGGYYRDALRVLRRLVKVNERNYEAQLRLALNLKRTGRLKDAEKKLRWLTQEGAPAWLGSLAFQELARMHMNRKKYDRAEGVLLRGRERFPNNQRLVVQQAFLLEHTNRLSEARGLLEDLRREPGDVGDTSRRRYNSMPVRLLQETRTELWKGAESRLQLLRSELDRPAPRVGRGRDGKPKRPRPEGGRRPGGRSGRGPAGGPQRGAP